MTTYNFKDTVLPQSQDGASVGVGRSSQDGDTKHQETGPFLIPQLNRLYEVYHVRGEDDSNMLWSRVVMNTSVFVRISTSLPLRRTEIGDLESQEEDVPKRIP